jgi:predicted dinucleotide-binding enzyme
VTIGIVGFGKLGTVLARLAQRAGYRVISAASGDPANITLIAEVLTPGVETARAADAIDAADIVILAVPLHALHALPLDRLDGKVVVDAANHWLDVDGPRETLIAENETSSKYVQRLTPRARVVKAFNHLGYHDLDERSRPRFAADRIAMAVAGDDEDAMHKVAELVDTLGFDPLIVGSLADSRLMEPGHPAFGAVLPQTQLKPLVIPWSMSTAIPHRA